MNGAEAVLRTLVGGEVRVCFANPGTTEMYYVRALEEVRDLRAVLTLAEGVATGAADGYARMTGLPAATLLHMGPGLANGLANLHNAMRAAVPLLNIVGDHATKHAPHDPPLASNISGYARQVSSHVQVTTTAGSIADDAARALAAARRHPGQVATLITPADCTWPECDGPTTVPSPPRAPQVEEAAVVDAASALRSGEPAMLMMSHGALCGAALEHAGRIAARCGARLASPFLFPRMARGAGRVPVERLPYVVSEAVGSLAGLRHLILVGTPPPVAFFGYPGAPSCLAPDTARLHRLAAVEHDLTDALARLADAVDARGPADVQAPHRPPMPVGALTVPALARAIAALLPEGCIVVDESLTASFALWPATRGTPPHDWLFYTGGAIGDGLPLAVGAAIACPDRRVLTIHSDGAAAYNVQALWTQAREQPNITTVIVANRTYRVLEAEYGQPHPGARLGPRAARLLRLDRPGLEWVHVARGMGVPAVRADTVEALATALTTSLHEPGPSLIEAVV